MLENTEHGSCIQDSIENNIRKPRFKFFTALRNYFKGVPRGLPRVEEPKILGRLDEEISKNVSTSDSNNIIMATIQKTREEQFADAFFEWIKTEKAGDISRFAAFEFDGSTEYVLFDDGSRINIGLIGEIVLMHNHESEILGVDLSPEKIEQVNLRNHQDMMSRMIGDIPFDNTTPVVSTQIISPIDPVVSLLEKSKKRQEKINISLSVKIPSIDLYNVIRENFDNVDEVILQSVIDQIQGKMIKDSVKRELQSIYQKKKKV